MADTFRATPRTLNTKDIARVTAIKHHAQYLFNAIDEAQCAHIGINDYQFAHAKARLEEAVMWAVKGVTA
jgi:hypothetical protein